MKTTIPNLRRIIRKTIAETFSDSQSTHRTSDLGKLPVGIDPSRHTGMSTSIDALMMAIDDLAVEEDLEQGEINGLRNVANKLNDCMTMGDDPEVCAMKLLDHGLDGAFSELGYIAHDSLGDDSLSNYILDVERIMGDGLVE